MEENQLPEVQEIAPDKKATARNVFFWVETFVLTFAILLTLVTFVVRYAPVEGASMTNTLQNGDIVLITNFGAIECGDIVVVQSERYGYDKPLVKRVIAKGGQTVKIEPATWSVYVDGILLDEPYVKKESRPMRLFGGRTEWTVPEGKLFVMGDNRNGSLDSRSAEIGLVDERLVTGKVFFRLFPFSNFGTVA
jgi:signal peptidase I